MKTAPRMHRPTAVIAAVLMSLTQTMNIMASRSAIAADKTGASIVDLGADILVAVLLVAVLLRGKKDDVSGGMLLFTLFAPLLSAIFNLASLLAGYDLVLYTVITAVSGFALALFRGLLAGDCLSRGAIAQSAGRVFLLLLSVVVFLCKLAAHVLLHLYAGTSGEDMMQSVILYMIPQWLPTILMGVSFSIRDTSDIGCMK